MACVILDFSYFAAAAVSAHAAHVHDEESLYDSKLVELTRENRDFYVLSILIIKIYSFNKR